MIKQWAAYTRHTGMFSPERSEWQGLSLDSLGLEIHARLD